ncbi:MAG: threonine/serine dehydratase [Pseudomonadota bacterium]
MESVASRPMTIRHELLGEMRVPVFGDVERAALRLRRYTRHTQLLRSPLLDEIVGGSVWIKPECLQVTGSFKVRGAINALLSLEPAQRARGVVAYSTGNHGQAIAWAARQTGMDATIVMPADAPKNKVAKALRHGARVSFYDRHAESREAIAMRLSAGTGGVLVPPGDHPDVLAGQGTLALEALRDLPPQALERLHTFIAPCGGGGLLASAGLVLEHLSSRTRIVAVEPAGFDDTARSLTTGNREANDGMSRSICDALLAATPAELPFAINQRLLSEGLCVTDAEVAAAMVFALEELHLVVEPGGAVALAALLSGRVTLGDKDAIVVLSGGNVDLPMLHAQMGRHAATAAR